MNHFPKHRKSLHGDQYSSCNNVTVNMSSTGGNIHFCVTWSSFGNEVNRLLLSTWEDFCGAFYWKCFNAVTTQWGMGCNWAESSRNPLLQKALVTGIVFIWSVSTIRFWSLFLNMFWQIHFFLFKFEESRQRQLIPALLFVTVEDCYHLGKPTNISNLSVPKDVTRGYILTSDSKRFSPLLWSIISKTMVIEKIRCLKICCHEIPLSKVTMSPVSVFLMLAGEESVLFNGSVCYFMQF